MSYGYTAGYAIASDSTNKDAAWKLIQYLSSPAVNFEYCKAFDALPIYSSLLNNAFFGKGPISAYAKTLDDPNTVLSIPPTYLPDFPYFTNSYSVDEVQKYLTRAHSADQTIKDLADFLTKDQQTYLKSHPSKK